MGLDNTAIIEQVKSLVPEAKESDDQALDLLIELASRQTSKRKFGRSYKPAIVWLTGHYLILARRRRGASGPITARRAGEVAENYGNTQLDPSSLNDTSYGRLYSMLLRRSPRISPTTTAPVVYP